MKHKLKVFSPYRGIHKLIGIVMWEPEPAPAEWILYKTNGEQIARGISSKSEYRFNSDQALINCRTAARKYVRKEYPLFFREKKEET